MSSIPLPALDVRPPEDPLSQYAKALSVQSMIGQQKTQQLQQTGMQQENQQREQSLNDQKAMTNAMQEWDGKSYNDLAPLVVKHGGSAQAVIGLKGKVLEQQEKYSKIAEQDATTGSKNIETLGKQNDMLLGHIDAVIGKDEKGTPNVADEDLVSRVNLEKNTALHGGYLDKDHAAAIDKIIETGNPDQIRGALKIFEKSLQGQKEQFDQAQKVGEAERANWKEIPGTNQFYNVKTQELRTPDGLKMTPQQAEAQYIALAQKKASGQSLSKDEQASMSGFEQYKKIIPAYQINNQFTGGGFGPNVGGGAGSGAGGAKTVNDVPANLRGQVQQILDYRGSMPPMGRNNPVNNAIRQWVTTLDPTYDETTFPARNKILNSYTSGPESKSINAINTALGHLGELKDAADAVSQNNIPLLHSLASKVGAAVGQDATSTYKLILHRVSPELTAAYVQGGGGEGERGANEGDFDLSKGASQINSNLSESAKLLRSKISSQENQWNTTFKPTQEKDKFENRFITPQAKATLDKLSPGTGTGGGKFNVPIPGGKTYSFATQAAADAFKKEAGIQ
jgi:hypothetical protein